MATVFAIQVVHAEREKAEAAIDQALDEIERLEALLSEWNPDSDISKINASAGLHPVEVGEEALVVVQAGLRVSEWSGGAFDLTWAALRGAYDFRPGLERAPTDEELAARLPKINWRDVLVDPARKTVFLKRKDMAIGTGAIAKGYALDRASAILRAAGLKSFMLFGGGQVQVHGTKQGRPWRVGVQHPRQGSAYFGFVEATDGSVSTSGDYEHAFIDASGKRYHHLLDPRTGRSAERSYSATVLAPEGIYSDSLSTALFILGPTKGLPMLESLPFEAAAVVVSADCTLTLNEAAKKLFVPRLDLDEAGRLPHCQGKP